ncbi:TPA: tyrosine-type recombinase/integrase [Yersinia enterocolitica]|uniref:tyrosine-type recombinase/integrase n=1 Tax=Yersiniaceae TaxID=1903411 RepID=UPI00077C37B7|nr:integrase family protein [Serratia grimesii]ELI7994237.1 integrase family protein [Yersinia enterocolitica]ELW7359291.1 integrase family protein [Yersinia enterocolitica]ELX2285244.1 integrase family protein [Yersinia enterocolitica]EMA2899948.1 integrase family protein [Yersinia enterocolitica]EMB6584174.1 integrase family protein [Yersinia enterocolitica]
MALARQKLTFERLRKFELTDGKSQEFLWDSDVTMLACRATKGTKAFIFQSVFLGKTLRMTIGKISDWKIDDARSEARRLQTLIDTGIDPRIAKAEKIAAVESQQAESRRGKVMFSAAWEEYLKELKTGISAKTKRPYSPRYLADHIRLSDRGGNARKIGDGLTIAAPLAFFLDLPLSEISPVLITEWLTRERQTRPTVTANAYRVLRTFLKWVNDHKLYQGIIPSDITQDRNVRKMVPVSASKADDCLQKEQLEGWFAEVKRLSNPVISTYLQVLLLTGARREEIASLSWSDIDFKWSSMRIKDKVEGERTIPLTPYVSAILSELAKFSNVDTSTDSWVFCSDSKSGRIVEPRKAHNRALSQANLPHISLHGLRRSFGTLAEWVEVPTGIVAQIMGHKPSALAEKHYRRRPLDLLRKWHEKIERWILQQANIAKK